jgi:release factor glutamine methyltransferase
MDNYCPFEYKRGYVSFLKCKINLSSNCFIPERETRVWVKRAIKNVRNVGIVGNVSVLDIFAGSGCIGIAILKYIKNSHVTFSEIDKNLIKQIKINLRLNKINSKRYKVIQSDIFRSFKDRKLDAKFDYIFANPPYIPTKNKYMVQDSVYNYEPHLALFGGKDGLLYIRKFLKDARKYLKLGGKIYMEFDHFQKIDLEKLLEKLNYTNYRIYKDQFKKYRYICIKN